MIVATKAGASSIGRFNQTMSAMTSIKTKASWYLNRLPSSFS